MNITNGLEQNNIIINKFFMYLTIFNLTQFKENKLNQNKLNQNKLNLKSYYLVFDISLINSCLFFNILPFFVKIFFIVANC